MRERRFKFVNKIKIKNDKQRKKKRNATKLIPMVNKIYNTSYKNIIRQNRII